MQGRYRERQKIEEHYTLLYNIFDIGFQRNMRDTGEYLEITLLHNILNIEFQRNMRDTGEYLENTPLI